MPYHILDQTNIVSYIRNHPVLAGHFKDARELSIHEIGDGNLNLVFIIRDAICPAKALIIKQALPYLRVAGDAWPLTKERARYEADALNLYNKTAPGLVPEVIVYDPEMSMIAMEFLGGHEVMRNPLVSRRRYPLFADHASTFLANVLFKTSDLFLDGPEKKGLQATFINPELCKIQEDFVFTNPYMESDENQHNPEIDADVRKIRGDWELKRALAELKELYCCSAQALIHGDLHTGSIMLNETDTRVIDPEFAFFGPMGYDLGALISNLMMNYASHFAHTENAADRLSYQTWLVETIESLWEMFASKFDQLWVTNGSGGLVPEKFWRGTGGADAFQSYRQSYILRLLREAAGLGACESLRRMMGIVSVWDISSISDNKLRATAERFIIRVSRRWILERQSLYAIQDLTRIMRAEHPDMR